MGFNFFPFSVAGLQEWFGHDRNQLNFPVRKADTDQAYKYGRQILGTVSLSE